jgi:hypothetical protein
LLFVFVLNCDGNISVHSGACSLEAVSVVNCPLLFSTPVAVSLSLTIDETVEPDSIFCGFLGFDE